MKSDNTKNVSVEKLTKRMGKYSLVIAASERAKELKRIEERLGDITPSNRIANALSDISDAKVKIIDEEGAACSSDTDDEE